METAVSIALGIGLSAAVGFRVFVPLLIMSVAGLTGYLELTPGFQWIGTWPAAVAFATATVVEVLAYYIPFVDHLLDTVATPAAVIGGVIASASVFVDFPPLLRWTLALIGGGGIAGIVQGATVLTRVKSTALTGGLGNVVVSTLELVGSVVTSLLALAVPVLTVILLLILLSIVFWVSGRVLFGRHKVST